jgi:hypothetical protein
MLRYWGYFPSLVLQRQSVLLRCPCQLWKLEQFSRSSHLSLLLARLLTSLVLFKIKSTQYSSKSINLANVGKMANLGIAG